MTPFQIDAASVNMLYRPCECLQFQTQACSTLGIDYSVAMLRHLNSQRVR
jgi:hypothetical protein